MHRPQKILINKCMNDFPMSWKPKRKFQKEGMTNRATCSQESEEGKGWEEFPGDMVLLVAWERARPCAGGGKV